ncbi:MAG: NusG domain II-containing protein [Clostridia bacterium]|jgi:hypothetical protein|nr:NusG domain II-containing protein [Clostridia bacterium]NLS85195.1 NusG domain II-containing protein [Oscillospiraceae bacterium]
MKRNVIFAAAIVVLAAVMALILYFNRQTGSVAVVSIVDAKSITLPLDEDKTVHIGEAEGAKLDVTLEIKDGAIRFIDSQCPDHICEGFGRVSHAGDTAVCMPAGVMISIN